MNKNYVIHGSLCWTASNLCKINKKLIQVISEILYYYYLKIYGFLFWICSINIFCFVVLFFFPIFQ